MYVGAYLCKVKVITRKIEIRFETKTREILKILLSLSTLQANTDVYANSVDPDETSRLIRIYTVCHSVYQSIETPIFNNGPVQIQRRQRPFQKLRGERVNTVKLFSISDIFYRETGEQSRRTELYEMQHRQKQKLGKISTRYFMWNHQLVKFLYLMTF